MAHHAHPAPATGSARRPVRRDTRDVDPAGLLGGAEPDEAGRGQRRRLLELVRHAAAIRDRGHREAVCALARELAALGGEEPTRATDRGVAT
jgi:hypothetical protein